MRICRDDFIKCPRSVIHPRHHHPDIEHLAGFRVQFLHQIFVVFHHVPLEGIMDMTIQVEGAIKVILKTWNWVVAKNHSTIIADLAIVPATIAIAHKRAKHILASITAAKLYQLIDIHIGYFPLNFLEISHRINLSSTRYMETRWHRAIGQPSAYGRNHLASRSKPDRYRFLRH